MLNQHDITALMLERQHLLHPADETEYCALYRDTSPGQNVYWCGFGQPPILVFRAAFDDMAFNRERQRQRELVKGRFQGGNLGWIEAADMELFACAFRRPLDRPTDIQRLLLELIEREGPLTIQQMKALTGLLVKEITPALHRLQQAFLLYEDQYDGEWDRGWYRFSEMFPTVSFDRYTKAEAITELLRRLVRRHVWINADMARAFYQFPLREIRSCLAAMEADGELIAFENGFLLAEDEALLRSQQFELPESLFVLHRNDCLVKVQEPILKERYRRPGCDILQFLLIDGAFHGAVLGHFKNGPYVLEDVVVDAGYENRRNAIVEAVRRENPAANPLPCFMGEPLQDTM